MLWLICLIAQVVKKITLKQILTIPCSVTVNSTILSTHFAFVVPTETEKFNRTSKVKILIWYYIWHNKEMHNKCQKLLTETWPNIILNRTKKSIKTLKKWKQHRRTVQNFCECYRFSLLRTGTSSYNESKLLKGINLLSGSDTDHRWHLRFVATLCAKYPRRSHPLLRTIYEKHCRSSNLKRYNLMQYYIN